MYSEAKYGKYTPNCMVYGELGRHKSMKTVELRMVSIWCVITTGKSHKLVHLIHTF